MECKPHKTYYRPDEVATIFDVSKKTVYGWISEGKLEAKKICGGTVRIERTEVERVARSTFE